jgi:hypothetical protein
MRLQKQLDIVSNALVLLGNFGWKQNGNLVFYKGKSAMYATLQSLLQLPYMQEALKPLLSLATFQLTGDEITFEKGDTAPIDNPMRALVAQVVALKHALTLALSPPRPNSLAIRLPEFSSPDELAKLVHQLDIILKPVVLGYQGDDQDTKTIEIIGFDSGSRWLNFYFGAVAVVAVVGEFAQASGYVAQERQRWAQAEAAARIYGSKAELAETIATANKALVADLVRVQAQNLNQRHYDGTPVQEESLSNSIRLMADLFDKNATIELAQLPPISEPPKAPTFPDLTQTLQGVSPPKQLPAPSEAPLASENETKGPKPKN